MKEDKTIMYMVYQILLNNPDTRECDRVFEAKCIMHEKERNDFIAYEFGILQGKFSKIGTLLTSKRKLQRKYPFLRGQNWEMKQIKGGQKKKMKCNPDQFDFFDKTVNL